MTYTRIQQKIDTSANWALATNFIPLEGELIIYQDYDTSGKPLPPRYKNGDGKTYVNNLPFSEVDLPIAIGGDIGSIICNDLIQNTANGSYAFASGIATTADGDFSNASGLGTHAVAHAQFALGRYYIEDPMATLVVGAGSADNRQNAFTAGNDGTNHYITIGTEILTEEKLKSIKEGSGVGAQIITWEDDD